MAQSAFIVGGTGQIGRAVAVRLAERGWNVVVGARNAEHAPRELERSGVQFAALDRSVRGALGDALGEGADVVVDVIAFTGEDARELVSLSAKIGSVVAVSSAAVYADGAGRSLDTQAEAFPDLPVPITERQPTVEAGEATYATRKVAMERVLLDSALRTTIVRPCAIHGPGSRTPRELHFVQRVLDGRQFVPLAYRGASRFHTTSVANLAELIMLAAERPGNRIVNCGDPDAPTVLQIGRAVAGALEHEWTELLLPGPPQGRVGDTPWTGPTPIVLDMLEAELELRYRPVTRYEKAVETTCRWLVETLGDRDWRDVFPEAVEYLGPLFDYGAEDESLRSLARQG